MEKSKITGYLFFLLSGIVGVIFLSSIVVIGEQSNYLNRLAVVNKNKNIDYFINFRTMPDTKSQFSKYFSKFPNLIYQNPKKGIFFFDIKNTKLKGEVEKIIKRFQENDISIEVFSNSKVALQKWKTKNSDNKINSDVHLIESPYLCFTNRCFDKFMGFQLLMKTEMTEKPKNKKEQEVNTDA